MAPAAGGERRRDAGGSSTFQITLRNDGSFRLAWGNLTNVAHDVLVGFAQGFGNVDPGPRDLSAGSVGFSAQAATLTPALNVLGFATSNGMAITLGH